MSSRAMVVVNGDDVDHDLITASLVFQQLGTDAGFATRRATGTSRFIDPLPHTAETDVFLLYTAGGPFPVAQQEALYDLVASGRGCVAIHDATLVDAGDHPLLRLFGGRAVPGGARELRREVIRVVPGHPITDGLDDFELVDEFAGFERDGEHLVVLAERTLGDGSRIPLMHAREVGQGRVVCLTVGHDARAWGDPSFRRLVVQATRWAGGRDA